MNHSEVNAQMTDYFEGDLVLSLRALVDAHLDSCQRCSREYSEMERTLSLLRSLPDVEIPQGFSSQVMRRIRSGEGERRWYDSIAAALRDVTAFVTSPRFAIPVSATATAMTIAYVTGTISFEFEPAQQGAAEQVARGGQSQVKVWIRPQSAPSPQDRIAQFHLTGRRAQSQSQGPDLRVVSSAASAPLTDFVPPDWEVTRVGEDGRQLDQDELRQRQLDQRLALIGQSPVRYARAHARLSLAEQELWAQNLATRAVELGEAEQVTRALVATRDPDALSLAQDIAGAAQIPAPTVVAAQRRGSP